MLKVSGKVTGVQGMQEVFKLLGAKVQNKILGDMTKAGERVVTAEVKKQITEAGAVETKSLLKAIGAKHKKYRGGKIAVAIIGARTEQRRQVTRTFTKRGKQRIKLTRIAKGKNIPGQTEVRDPAKYLHLADRGRKAVRARKKLLPIRTPGGQVVYSRTAREFKGHNFMKKAARASRDVAAKAMLLKLEQGMREAVRELEARAANANRGR